jgi:hypothetical protein
MPAPDSSFTDDVARFYEATLVPLVFQILRTQASSGSCSNRPHPH